MADPNDAFSTLDDFLLSLADGVTQAQAELARAGVLGPPGAQFSYHLPRLEFELKLNLRVVEDAALSNRYQAIRPVRSGDRHLMFRPALPGAAPGSGGSTLDIAATLRGELLAVPANEGLPATRLSIDIDAREPKAPRVIVQARNTAGEALAGLAVEFNVDREETLALAVDGQGGRVAEGTAFKAGRVLTDADGVAIAELQLGNDQKPAWLALVVDAAGQIEQLVYEVHT